jgi:hypothetical protein
VYVDAEGWILDEQGSTERWPLEEATVLAVVSVTGATRGLA